MITRKQIIKQIGNKYLELYKGEYYFYFVYSAGDIYDTKSVYTATLDSLSMAEWVEEGNSFIMEVLSRELDRI